MPNIAESWRTRNQRYRMEGSVCPETGRMYFPPKPERVMRALALKEQMAASPVYSMQILELVSGDD